MVGGGRKRTGRLATGRSSIHAPFTLLLNTKVTSQNRVYWSRIDIDKFLATTILKLPEIYRYQLGIEDDKMILVMRWRDTSGKPGVPNHINHKDGVYRELVYHNLRHDFIISLLYYVLQSSLTTAFHNEANIMQEPN